MIGSHSHLYGDVATRVVFRGIAIEGQTWLAQPVSLLYITHELASVNKSALNRVVNASNVLRLDGLHRSRAFILTNA